jgi:molybdopterin-guanine dinucleotide biosynthesis protein A
MTYSAIILAGGKGKRTGYREKALMEFNGKPLITYIIKSLEKVVDDIIISVRDKAQEELLISVLPGYTYVSDVYENTGPLSGILSSLGVCRDEFCFIAACDMPFINENVVELLFRKSENHDAAIVRHEDGHLEPLHAVYKCKPMVFETKEAIKSGKTKILAPIHRMKVNYVEIEDIRKIDPDLKTFININTLEDFNRIVNNLSS